MLTAVSTSLMSYACRFWPPDAADGDTLVESRPPVGTSSDVTGASWTSIDGRDVGTSTENAGDIRTRPAFTVRDELFGALGKSSTTCFGMGTQWITILSSGSASAAAPVAVAYTAAKIIAAWTVALAT